MKKFVVTVFYDGMLLEISTGEYAYFSEFSENGVMIDLVANTSSWYTYMIYDSEVNLVKETIHMCGWDGCKKINGVEVIEEEWNKQTELLFEEYTNRPLLFSYEELYE